LWVASSELYPQIEPGQAQTDKIIVLEDTTGAGKADKATVFADGLLIPTGLEVGHGGVYVAQSTELLHFRDNDGDGKSDERRVILSGFGTEDTHHNLHTLRWGPDGRLYLNQSVYTRTNAETPHGVTRLMAGGIFRLDPRDQRMEVLYRGWVNSWGHQFDDFGQSFATDGAGGAGINWAVPGATYRTLAPARRELQSISPGSYPKFCGLEIIRSAHFPADWQGDFITADFRAHRIVRFKAAEQGSGYITSELPDVLRTTADSFRPIDIRLGPDGALYVADWSNPIIQHGEVDFRDPRRDKAHGRIWRISVKGRAPLPRTDLTRLANRDLLERLAGPNGYEQEQSRRVLVERGAAAVGSDLEAWAARQTTEPAKLQALWLRQAFNATPADSAGLLTAADPRVRSAAVRALPVEGALRHLEKLVADPHPRVRLEAVRALGRQGSARAAELALSALDHPMDPYLDYAVWLTVNELAGPWLDAVKSGAWRIAGREKQLEFGLKAVEPALAGGAVAQLVSRQGIPADGSGPWIELIGSAGGAAELRRLLDLVTCGTLKGASAVRALAALTEAARLRDAKPPVDPAALGVLFDSSDAAIRRAAVQ
ncbi:MAG: PVC-type heme-binding CxxCH protein, partial [Opitutaceae bacterium]